MDSARLIELCRVQIEPGFLARGMPGLGMTVFIRLREAGSFVVTGKEDF